MSPAKSPRYVAYFRVSTKRQGASGLGLESQQACVEQMVASRAGKLVATFTEVESGKLASRPELQRAIAAARGHKATLIVAKLDRLSRNAAFLFNLRDAGVDILACDIPDVSNLVLGIMAVVAESEAKLIAERTKAALAAAKARGVKLGTPNLTDPARRVGTQVSAKLRAEAADRRAQDLAPIITELQDRGITTLSGIAAELNALGYPAPRGGSWSATTVMRTMKRGSR